MGNLRDPNEDPNLEPQRTSVFLEYGVQGFTPSGAENLWTYRNFENALDRADEQGTEVLVRTIIRSDWRRVELPLEPDHQYPRGMSPGVKPKEPTP